MPKAPKKLPEGFTEDTESARVFCNVCSAEERRKWLKKDSIRNHVKTKEHLTCLERATKRENMINEQVRLATVESRHMGVLRRIDENEMSYQMQIDDRTQDMQNIFLHELLVDENGNNIQFSAGNMEEDISARKKLQDDFEHYQLYGWMDEDIFDWEDDIGQTNVAQQMHAQDAAGDTGLPVEEDISDNETEDDTSSDNGWFPYKNKTICMLDLLDSLPRLRLSDAQMRAILFVMKQCGASNVPSLSTLRRAQVKLRKIHGVPVRQCTSGRGSVFYTYDINGQIAKDFANPLVRPHLHFYPEETADKLYETWNAKKWCKDLDDKALTPMALGVDGEHFYINELVQCRSGKWIIPRRWVKREGELYAYSHTVKEIADGEFERETGERQHVALKDMASSLKTLRENNIIGLNVTVDGCTMEYHPLRVKAGGRPCFAVQMKLWADDVSGNRSKQWNKHWVWCMAHAGLPKTLLHQEYFIRYICCSQNATVSEQASEICDQIRVSTDGVIAFDAILQQEIIFFVNIFQLSGDNPMLSELCSHIGLSGNMLCYRCKVGGTKEHKMSCAGYEALFSPGPTRTVTETKEAAEKQLKDGLQGVNIEDMQRLSGVKDPCVQYWLQVADSRDKEIPLGESITGIPPDNESWIACQRGTINPLLEIDGFDPHIDSPVEPLHTILLGMVKYCWAMTCEKLLSGKKLSIFQARLQSIDTKGMNIPTLRASYLIQYRGALIGRQFKALMQVMIFSLHGLVANEHILLWRTIGEVGALLWHPIITKLDKYLEDLKDAIDNHLDCLSSIDSSRIVSKPKAHILTHIIEDIRRFGPAVLLSTEMFEGFNAVWRLCSILSNHHAPSRDIALNLADMDRFKQIASGVQWKEKEKTVQAGVKLRLFMNEHQEVQNYLGWAQKLSVSEAGKVTLAPKKKFPPKSWNETRAAAAIPYYSTENFGDELRVNQCMRVVAANGDLLKVGNYVVAQNESDQDTVIGVITEIVQLAKRDIRDTEKNIVTLEQYYIGAQHGTLMMPTIHQYDETVYIRMEAKHIKFAINVQHDCERGLCKAGKVRETQERQETTRDLQVIQHSDCAHFIINVLALHNTHLLRSVIPEEYYKVPKVAQERLNFHAALAEKLHKKADIRKETTQARRQATKAVAARNKEVNSN